MTEEQEEKIYIMARNKLIRILSKQVDNPDLEYRYGICQLLYSNTQLSIPSSPYVAQINENLTKMFFAAIKLWPKYSGSSNYPVPGNNGIRNGTGYAPLIAYSVAARNCTLWVGEYGELRFELLVFIINQISLWDTRSKFKRCVYRIPNINPY